MPNISLFTFEINRNQRSHMRRILIEYINNISISDMDSVRTQSGMLAMITSQTDEITRDIQVDEEYNLKMSILPKELN
jgi:preprotein translocase subunit YajC